MPSKEELRIRKLVQGASRPEQVVPLVLKAGIRRQIDDLEKRLLEVKQNTLDSLSGNPEATAIGAQIDALVEEAKDSTINVTIRALHRREWSDLRAKYPHKNPVMYLYDAKIFEEAIPACWVAPEVDDETRDAILDKITDGQWDELAEAVKTVNGDVKIPFSALATVTRQTSVENEQPPAPTE